MQIEDLEKLLLSCGSLTIGAYLTGVRSKVSSSKAQNRLHYVFYAVCLVVLIISLYTIVNYWDNLTTPNWFLLVTITACIVSSCLLGVFTWKNARKIRQYTTRDLDPIVNNFTKDADTDNIILIAGDLNFFGQTPQEMTENSQYQCLLEVGFRNIQILCYEPRNIAEKRRYAKVLNDFRNIEIKFYEPADSDLKIRGRMKKLRNIQRLLIYKKVKAGVYEALEWDTADENGALYTNLWNLLWSLGLPPSEEQIREYKELLLNQSVS